MGAIDRHQDLYPLTLDDLSQGVHDTHQVALRLHHICDQFVGGWHFIDNPCILRVFDPVVAASWPARVNLRFALLRDMARPVAATVETVFVPTASHDKRLRPHAAGDDPRTVLPRPPRILTGGEDALAKMRFDSDVVMMAVYYLLCRVKRWNLPGGT